MNDYFTVTVTSPLAAPAPPVQVILYILVVVGWTKSGVVEFEFGLPVPICLLVESKMEHVAGPAADQESTAVCPDVIVLGLAMAVTADFGSVIPGVVGVVGVVGAGVPD